VSAVTGIVLAAGRGSRMGGLTADAPKCFARLAGRRLIDWQLAALSAAGIEHIVIVAGYRADLLASIGCTTIQNPRWAETNMVASLMCARHLLAAGECVVLYSDIVFHPSALRHLLASADPLAITYDRSWESLWRQRFDDPLQDAETFRLEGGRLADIGRRTTCIDEIQGQYMGLLRIAPLGFRAVEALLATLDPRDVDRLDTTKLLSLLLARGTDVAVIPVDGRWCEVDCADDLACYETAIARVDAGEAAWAHDWR